MSYSRYVISQRTSDHRWDLSGTEDGEDGETVLIGTYTTAAEALDVSGGTLFTGGGSGGNVEVSQDFTQNPLYYDVLAPFDWESLPPSPVEILHPEVTRDEMIRAVRGLFYGLKVRASMGYAGGFTNAAGNNVSSVLYANTAETDVSCYRVVPHLASKRNFQKALSLVGDENTHGTQLLPYLFHEVLNTQGGYPTPITAEEFSQATVTVNFADGTSYTGYLFGDRPDFRLGFYRGHDDKTCHLYLRIQSKNLYAYAPVLYLGDRDFDDSVIYNIPRKPDDDTEGDYIFTYTEISGDGPVILGVTTKLYGWTTTVTANYRGGSGSYYYRPSLAVEESGSYPG